MAQECLKGKNFEKGMVLFEGPSDHAMLVPFESWSEAASTFLKRKGGSEPDLERSESYIGSSSIISVSPSWSDAAEVFLLSSQTESEEIEQACALRVDSDSECEVVKPLAPELYWVKPLLECLHKHLPGGPGGLGTLEVVSACSGTLAEACVLKDWWVGGAGGCNNLTFTLCF